MPYSHDPHAHPLVRKLQSVFSLSESEIAALASLPMQIVDIEADQNIVREGDRPSRCCLMLEGFACAYKMTGEGKRQILAFFILGDVPDLQSLHLPVLDNSIMTLADSKVAFINHEAIRELCLRHPRITGALWRETLIDASVFREWIVNVGRRDAKSRTAHVICELVVRMQAVGLGKEQTHVLPITQVELGDALGVSSVHANRVLQDLREEGLFSWQKSKLEIHNWDTLKRTGDFEPDYLHLRQKALAATH